MNRYPTCYHMIVATAFFACRLSVMYSECPNGYWDKPSKRCADKMLTVLDEMHLSSNVLSVDIKINKTCAVSDYTNWCYSQLMRQCNGDRKAQLVLRAQAERYHVFTMQCHLPSLKYKQLFDCFITYFYPTQTCSEAFDQYFRSVAQDKVYGKTCRVISSAMRCFHDVKMKISSTCDEDGAKVYEKSFIEPLVDQIRETVVQSCTIVPPYDQYFFKNSATYVCLVNLRLLVVILLSDFLWLWKYEIL